MVLTGLVDRSGVRTIYGDPVTSGEITVVPAARVAFGFGGGEGKGERDGKGGEGSGGGGGFVGTPSGYIEIGPQGTRWVPINDRKRLAAALALGIVIGLVLGYRRRKA